MSNALATRGRCDKVYKDSGRYTQTFYIATPRPAMRNAQGELQKRRFGSRVKREFLALPAFKGPRGELSDALGWTAERRTERPFIGVYVSAMRFAPLQQTERPNASIELAELRQHISSYGYVEDVSIERACTRKRELLTEILVKDRPEEQPTVYHQYSEGK